MRVGDRARLREAIRLSDGRRRPVLVPAGTEGTVREVETFTGRGGPFPMARVEWDGFGLDGLRSIAPESVVVPADP